MSAEEPPLTLERYLEIGFLRLQENMLNNAELIFLEVLRQRPHDAAARRFLGVTRFKLGRTAEALADLQAGADLAGQSAVAWGDLAVGLKRAGHAEAAAQAYDQASSLAAVQPTPGHLPPLASLAFTSERAVHDFTLVDYPYVANIRHGAGRPSHPELSALLAEGAGGYAAVLAGIGEMQADFAAVPLHGSYEDNTPFWINAWFPPLDAAALTQMLRRYNPARFVEIGSGMSTKYARRAVATYGLRTRLNSIDPEPRASIDQLCDNVIRKPLERCDPALFQALEAGDILFLDSSHRSFQGSDVTVFFMEILPRLKPGVVVHLHDIYLPDDYISGHIHRLWNEQYLLATALLFGRAFEVLFPSWYVGQDPALRLQAQAALCQGPLSGLDPYGASFWMVKR